MEEKRVTDRDMDLWFLFDRTRQSILKVRAKELVLHDITPSQAHVLRIIHELGSKVMLKEISDLVFREVNSISEQIDRMVKKGFLKKKRKIPGTNRTRFELTEKGLKAYDFIIKRGSIHLIMSVLSEEERKQLELCLEKLFIKSEEI